jgi:hypothetical protein
MTVVDGKNTKEEICTHRQIGIREEEIDLGTITRLIE